MEEAEGFEAGAEVADFDDEVGFVEDDVDAGAGIFGGEAVFHGEGL